MRVVYGKSSDFKINRINYIFFFLKKNVSNYNNMILSNNTKSNYLNIFGKKINTNLNSSVILMLNTV